MIRLLAPCTRGYFHDAAVLRLAMAQAGVAEWTRGDGEPELTVCLGHVPQPVAGRAWMVINPEMVSPGHVHNAALVLCKSRDAHEIVTRLGTTPAVYTGWTSIDRYKPSTSKDYRRPLHIAGRSPYKGTEPLLDAWRRHPEWPLLTVVRHGDNLQPLQPVPSNVRVVGSLEDGELQTLQNQCGIHICPSEVEGFGHTINEAMSCGAVVITTDAPPMSELVPSGAGLLVPAVASRPQRLGTRYSLDMDGLERVIGLAVGMREGEALAMGEAARRVFQANQIDAVERIGQLLQRPRAPHSLAHHRD